MGREGGSSLSFEIKDSGKRQEFAGGMVRDTTEGKVDFTNLLHGPMFRRAAVHMTKGREKYPDPEPGVPNWTLAEGQEEYQRARQSALRHLIQWLDGDVDEDHAAAVYFNINLAEYVKDKMAATEKVEGLRKVYERVEIGGVEIISDSRVPPGGSPFILDKKTAEILYPRTPKCGEPSASAIPCNLGQGHAGPHSWQPMDTRRTDGLA